MCGEIFLTLSVTDQQANQITCVTAAVSTIVAPLFGTKRKIPFVWKHCKHPGSVHLYWQGYPGQCLQNRSANHFTDLVACHLSIFIFITIYALKDDGKIRKTATFKVTADKGRVFMIVWKFENF